MNFFGKDRSLGRALDKVEKLFKSTGQQAEESLDKASRHSDTLKRSLETTGRSAEQAFDKASRHSDLLDQNIDQVRRSLNDLNREFAETGNQELFPQIARERRLLAKLNKIQRELEEVGDEADEAARHLGFLFAASFVGRAAAKIPGALGSLFASLPPQLAAPIAIAGAAIAVALATAVGAALTGGVLLGLGGAVLAGGIFGAIKTDTATAKLDSLRDKAGESSEKLKDLRQRYKEATTESSKKRLLGKIQEEEKNLKDLNKELERTKKKNKDIAVVEAFRDLGKTAKKSLGGFFNAFRKPLVRAAKTFGKMFERLGPTFTRIGKTLAPLIDKLAPAFAKFIENMMPGLEKGLKAAAPLFEKLAEHAPALGTAFSKFFTILGTVGGEGATTFFDHLLSVIEWLLPVIAGFFGMLAAKYQGIVVIVRTVVAAVSSTWEALKTNFNTLKTFISNVWNAIVSFFRMAWTNIKNAVMNGVARVKGFINRLAEIPGKVAAWFQSMKDKASQKISSLVATAKGIPGRIKRAIGNLASLLVKAGKKVIQGLIDGIKDKVDDLKSTLSWVTDLIPDWKGPLSKDRKLLEPTGKAIMQGLNSGINKSIPTLRKTLAGVTKEISVGKGLKSAAREMLNHIKKGGKYYEDFSFTGYSSNLRYYNDTLVQISKMTRGKHELSRSGDIKFLQDVISGRIGPRTGLLGAVEEMFNHVGSKGYQFFEDFTFRGMSSNAEKYHDQVARLFFQGKGKGYDFNEKSRGDVSRFLWNFIQSHRAPKQPNQSVTVNIDVTGADEDMKKLIRKIVRVDGRGSVQTAFGRG